MRRDAQGSAFSTLGLFGRSIVVTGAGSGIGRASAELLARRGARIVVADRDEQGGHVTVENIRSSGGTAAFISVDVSEEESVAELIARSVETLGTIDGAFNNAGIAAQSALHETSGAQWLRVIGINVTGVFFCLKHEISHMLEHGGGSIVNTASLATENTVSNMPAYIASKAAVVGLTRSASFDYAGRGIRVNAVLPGAIRTPMLAAVLDDPVLAAQVEATQPLGEAADVAEQVAWLLSDAAKFTTGAQFLVDGGASVI